MRLLAVAAFLAAVSAAVAAETQPRRLHKKVFYYPPHVVTLQGSFIVEFEDGNTEAHAAQLDAVPGVAVRKRFDDLFHGAVVAAGRNVDPETLAGVAGVKRVWRNRKHTHAVAGGNRGDKVPAPQYLHQMTGVAQAHRELGLDGRGVRIGIIDSGVDLTHPDLGNCWKTKGCAWQFGRDFVGDEYNIADEVPVVKPRTTPQDCSGHGTHVSGIIAANGTQVQGVAPGATLGMYRVISCPVNGELATDDSFILQAMEAAFKDKMDIINMSIGSVGWPEDPVAMFAARLVDRGVVVVAAAGNEGADGLLTGNSPGVGRGVISVGSVDNWNITAAAASITTPRGTRAVQLAYPGNNEVPFEFAKATPLAVPRDSAGSIQGCNPIKASLAGAIAVVERGNCTFTEKAHLAAARGAVGLIVINTQKEMLSMDIARDVKIPSMLVNSEDGAFIVAGVAAGKTLLVAKPGAVATFVDAESGGHMSSFSSYGPDAELGLVPLISAPGGNIWSTYPVKRGSYQSMSGTSMSAPYISGVAALLKQARPELTVGQIRAILANTAAPVADAASGLAASPFSSGAGLVDVFKAATARAIVTPPVLSINTTAPTAKADGYPDAPKGGVRISTHTLVFNNTDRAKQATVVPDMVPAAALTMFGADGNYAPSFANTGQLAVWPVGPKKAPATTVAQVRFSSSKVTVAAGASAELKVTIAAPYGLAEAQRWFFGGFVRLAATWDGDKKPTVFSVPFGGYNGDYRQSPVLSPKALGLPAFVDQDLTPIKTVGLTISPAAPAAFAFRIDTPTALLWTALIDAAKRKTIGYLPGGVVQYVPRSLPSTSPVFVVMVNNTVHKDLGEGKPALAPPGKYRVRLAALRPFGDPAKASDFEVWDSEEFSFK
ncbi:hypothetical protein H4R19_002121 [Coemansia spiralis]|nr:hypothetical protein H4R19_002121 [Coemansia spiralis]